jgi:glutamate-5-semialdehyde dehydrogenase
METLLVHEAIAGTFLPALAQRLDARGVTLRGDERARAIVPTMDPASEADWDAEYLDLVLAVRVVPTLEAAIEHIARHGSQHSDAIVAESDEAQQHFVQQVDSAAVYVNASTRFTDGGEFGMGAEIGISTDKLHARGPMGLRELTSYKWIGRGSGQVRA